MVPDDFRITVAAESNGVTVLTVSGELDIATADTLQSRTRRTLAEGYDVVIDLAGVTFFDCSGLRALIVARHVAAQFGARLRLRAPSPAVERILQVTGVRDSFDVEPAPVADVHPLASPRSPLPPAPVPGPRGDQGFAHSA